MGRVKIGLSSYSLARAIDDGRMNIFQAMDFIAANKGCHIEIVPCGKLVLTGNHAFIADIVRHAKNAGLAISSYTTGANFVLDTPADVRKETERVKGEIETAAELGVSLMRHDAGWLDVSKATYAAYEKYLPQVADAFRTLADYAKPLGITTSVENHGFLFQGSERIQRLINAVDRENFRTTLDAGNFICCDEDPVIAVRNNLPFASMIHFKDFYLRDNPPSPDGLYSRTLHGRYFRGAVTGEGDLDLRTIANIIQGSAYEGFLSIEFEGREDCIEGSANSLKNVLALFGEN